MSASTYTHENIVFILCEVKSSHVWLQFEDGQVSTAVYFIFVFNSLLMGDRFNQLVRLNIQWVYQVISPRIFVQQKYFTCL